MRIKSHAEVAIKYIEKKLPDEFPLAYYPVRPAFDNSKGLHFHNGIEIGFCHEGSGLFFVYNKLLPYSKGDVIILFPDQPHVATSSTETPGSWSFMTFDPDRLFHSNVLTKYEPVSDVLCHRMMVPNLIQCVDHPDTCELIRQVFVELREGQTGFQLVVRTLLWAFFLRLPRMVIHPDAGIDLFGEAGSVFASVTPAIDFISENYHQELPVHVLAELCFLSPAQFSEFITPYLADLIKGYRDMGYYTIKHTDGNIMPILDQLVQANPHALHSIDPQAGVDIAEVKRLYGDRVCLIGNVNCGLLETGTEEQVRESARYALRSGMPGYGYIFSTSNCVYTGMDLKRYELIWDVWDKEGVYR
jgi:hypothetical protein